MSERDFWHLQDRNDLASVRARLAGGESPTARFGSFGETPLHLAAAAGAAEAVTAMLAHTREVDIPDELGRTPLWGAVEHLRGKTVQVLLESGADAWRPCVDEWTPGRLALTTDLARLMAAGRVMGAMFSGGTQRKSYWGQSAVGLRKRSD